MVVGPIRRPFGCLLEPLVSPAGFQLASDSDWLAKKPSKLVMGSKQLEPSRAIHSLRPFASSWRSTDFAAVAVGSIAGFGPSRPKTVARQHRFADLRNHHSGKA